MSDITTTWSTTHGDYRVAGADLASGQDLRTAVILSLFTDRAASAEDDPGDASGDRRGWWADPTDGQPVIGSRLWLLERAKRTQETLTRAQDYIAEALQWLIDDGVVAAFDIEVEWTATSTLGARVAALRTDGQNEAMNFTWVWTQ